MDHSCYAMMVTQLGGPEVMVYSEMEMPKPQLNEALIRQTAIGVNYVDIYLRA